MFRELTDILLYGLKRFITSRFLVVAILFLTMFGALVYKLYDLQIVNSDYYQENYTQKTQKTLTTTASRGIIYDRNGNILAYNELTYSVTFTDSGTLEDGFDKNEMLLPLIEILNEHGETIVSSFPMAFDSNGNIVFTTSSDSEKSVLLQNIYGVSTEYFDTEDSNGNMMYSNPDPEYFFQYALYKFGIGYDEDTYGTDNETTYEIDPEVALQLLNIRYSMYLKAYMKYESVTIAQDLQLETVTEILEHSDEFTDISIEEETVRVYNYAIYFAHIIGYTGVASESDLEELLAQDDSYETGDIVGRAGLEQTLELELSGTKGYKTILVDSEGVILEVTEEVEAEAGNDIYLTLDAELQQAVYHILEQKLASILSARIVNYEVDLDEIEDSSSIVIPVKTAYFQLINNNVLSMSDFAASDASEVEQAIYLSYSGRLLTVISQLSEQLVSKDETSYADLSERQQEYYECLYDYILDQGYFTLTDEIREDEVYQSWKSRACSFSSFLIHAINNNWLDVTSLSIDSKYVTAEETYQLFVSELLDKMQTSTDFAKLIYEYLIEDGVVTGRQLCLALFYQGVLTWDEDWVVALTNGSETTAYEFLIEKITNIEITPQQLALDPCTAACTVIDVNTGEPLAVVTYPGYDNNYLSETVDAAYYSSLLSDLSNPLYNNATQARMAPGSTFKMITAIAGLEEGVITSSETIQDAGIFTEINLRLRCWIYPSSHGAINVIQAISVSCNYFFSEVGYRLSTDSSGNYNEALGLSLITKYAEMFGLGSKTGIEITELTPQISTTGPVASSIGQGSHAFTNISMARYVTAIANQGTVYELTLLKTMTDSEGNVLAEYSSGVANQVSLMDSTWLAIRTGMRSAVSSGSISSVFTDCIVEVAGKTGTAEESSTRGPHSWFVGYAPYDAPEIAIAVTIPYGYSSSNAAEVAEEVFEYYFGALDLETILTRGASVSSGVTIAD